MSRDWHHIKRMIACEWLILVSCLPIGLIVIPLGFALIAAWPDFGRPLTPVEREIRALIQDQRFKELSYSKKIDELRDFLETKKWPEVTPLARYRDGVPIDLTQLVHEQRVAEQVLNDYSSPNPFRRELGKIYRSIAEKDTWTSVLILTLIPFIPIQFVRSVLWAIRATRRV